MFRSLSGEGHLSGGQSSSPPAGGGVASPGRDSQESSWIGLLSRPASFLLQKYLPGRPRWKISGGLKTSFVEEENEFLRQLDDMMPAPHLTFLRCQHDGAAGLLEPNGGSASPWLSAESLRELGIQSAEEMDFNLCQQTQTGYLSSVRTFFSDILLSSSQEIRATRGKDWEPAGPSVKSSGGRGRTWWGSFWGGEGSSQRGLLSDLSAAEVGLCPQQPVSQTKAPETTLGETTGPPDHKEEPVHNGGLQTVQNTEGGSTPDHRLSIPRHWSGSGATATCSEAVLLTPDQDNGYSSLEEEHVQVNMVNAPSEEQEAKHIVAEKTEAEEENSEKGEEGPSAEEEGGPSAAALTSPQCQNKAIAFIMGCPYSDGSQSEGGSSEEEEEDDDGFDSEGSSDLSSTDDEEDEDSDSEVDSEADSEAERLWSSLLQSEDPYNPRNFTARLHTVSSPPRSIPRSTATPPSSTESTPASSPDLAPLPLSSLVASSSPQSGSDTWDDSTSASELDEVESLRLLSSFSCSSDPYSPYNFQATLRTQDPGPRTRTRVKKASRSRSPRPDPASPPEYRKEEAEERLDSGFSEPSTSSSCCSTTKKVRFCDDVDEFFASCDEEDEDRRGPWEELARDRCRFLRRCHEVEQSISYCLQPHHRLLVFRRLSPGYVQDA